MKGLCMTQEWLLAVNTMFCNVLPLALLSHHQRLLQVFTEDVFIFSLIV